MLTSNGVSFTLDLDDKATPKYQAFTEEVKAGASDVQNNVNQLSNSFKENGKQVSAVTQFYREHKGEMREQSFYMRGMRESINAMSFGFLALMGSQNDASESTKKMNKGLMEGFAAFQGLNLLMAGMGAGPWGMAVAGLAGIAIAVYDATKNTVDYNKVLEEQQKELDTLIKSYESYEKLLQGTPTDNIKLTEEEVSILKAKQEILSQVIASQTKGEKDVQIVINDVGKSSAQISAMEVAGNQAIGKTLNQNKKAYQEINDLLKVRAMALNTSTTSVASPETSKDPTAAARQAADIENEIFKAKLDAYEQNMALYNQDVEYQYNEEVKENEDKARKLETLDKSLYSKERQFHKSEHQNELDDLKDWESQSLTLAGDNETLKTRIKQVASDERTKITKDEFQKEAQQYVEFGNVAVASLTTIFGQSKAMSIAQATVNTYEAATKALTLPPPMNWIEEALVIAAGLADVAQIESQNFAHGTMPSGFRVPSGYPNDSYKIGVSSGEDVHVGKSKSSSGGHTFNISVATTLGKQELINLMKGLTRSTGQTIEALSKDNRAQLQIA